MLDERKYYKLRSKPEDFIVEEIIEDPEEIGEYSLYLLEKRRLTTLEALKIISKSAGIPFRSIGYAGLKDKHAIVRQYITVPKKYYPSLNEPNLKVKFVGYRSEPLKLGDHLGNRFTVTFRKISFEFYQKLRSRSLKKFPIPNYFDSQRFGLIKGSGEFPALRIIKGDYEGALKLLMTSYYRKERSYVKKLKKFIKEHWGDWKQCREFLEKGRRYENFHELIEFLETNSGEYYKALKLMRRTILELIISSFQAYLWNEALKKVLKAHLGDEMLFSVKYAAGELFFIKDKFKEEAKDFYAEYADKTLELPHPDNEGEETALYDGILNRLGIKMSELSKLEDIAKLRKTKRKMLFNISELKVSPWVEEDHGKARISFEVPPGCYATVFLKSLLE